MDTDSAYMALSKPSLEQAIKPHMLDLFIASVKHSCNDADYESDGDKVWFPRTCCKSHCKFDSRTPGLFKEEATGEKMVALSSKCYLLKQGDKCKISCKGVNKCGLDNPLDIFTSVLETKHSVKNINRGIRVRNGAVFSYEQQKNGFSYFYCKRQVLSDGVSTVPLDIVLCPVNDLNMVIFDSSELLSPFHLFQFSFAGKVFTSVYQCFLYQKAFFLGQHCLLQDILTCGDEKTLREIDVLMTPTSNWVIYAQESLLNICMEKMRVCLDIQMKLRLDKTKQFYYANEQDLWLGCGLNQSLIRLINPDSFLGEI